MPACAGIITKKPLPPLNTPHSVRRTRYFDLGCALSGREHLALYQPVTDRFYLTLDDVWLAQEIKKIMSGRFDLWICRIDQCQNYSPNLIDNECCFDWSLANKTDVVASRPWPMRVIEVSELVSAEPMSITDRTHVIQQQDHMHLIRFWAGYIKAMKSWLSWYDLEDFMSKVITSVPEGSLIQYLQDLEKFILSQCYHGLDVETVDAAILNRVNSHALSKEIYELWQQDNLS